MTAGTLMTQTRRERLQEATRTEIKTIARRMMAAEGTAALSLRGIAREMGMSAPSLYHYYASRDDLTTALIVDAYESLGAALEQAQAAEPFEEYATQFLNVASAYRAWALAYPVDYTLIYGNPIPGYHAPAEITVPVVRRALRPFAALMEAAWVAGELRLPSDQEPIAELDQRLVAWGLTQQLTMPSAALRSLTAGWSLIQGMVMLELFGHIQPIIGDPDAWFHAEVRTFLRRIGMHRRKGATDEIDDQASPAK